MENSLQAFLQASADLARQCAPHADFEFRSYDEAYLRLGSPFSRDPFSKREREALMKVLRDLSFVPQIKQCFRNAALALRDCRLEYAEGKATSLIPVDHAWNVFEGRVVDLTWRNLDDRARTSPKNLMKRIERNLEESMYWGICVPEPWLWEHHLKRKLFCPVLDDPPEYDILKTGKLPWKV